jgi:DUF4097 and DUF4098 domain-containing protein YvlB
MIASSDVETFSRQGGLIYQNEYVFSGRRIIMRGRRIGIIIVGILFLGVLGLCGLTVYGSYSWLRAQNANLRILDFATVSAEATETRQYQLPDPIELEIETEAGDITLIAEDRPDVEVEIVKTAWGASEAEALAAAEALRIEEEQQGGRLTLRYLQPETIDMMSARGGADEVSFTVRAPIELAAKLVANQGEVEASGATGPLEITNSFGGVRVHDHTGRLSINGDYGNLDVQDSAAGAENVDLNTTFGDLSLQNLAGADFQIGAANGRVTIQGLTATGTVTVSNQFGDMEISDLRAAALDARNQNGKVSVEQGELDRSLEVTSEFADVTVEQVTADRYTLKTNNGDLIIAGAHGALELENTFGDILITGATDAVLDLKTENGNIDFSGALDPGADHTIQNSFGNISLAFPAESAFDLLLKTEFGQIRSEFPVTISGALSETEWQGTLNGGGPLLSATTNNGNISLSPNTTEN